jgi:hypothetical protein
MSTGGGMGDGVGVVGLKGYPTPLENFKKGTPTKNFFKLILS